VSLDPRILFIDQTGKLGGAELCLADLAVHVRNSCAVFLFESGPFQHLLRRKAVRTVVAAAGPVRTNVPKNAKLIAYLLAVPAFVRLVVTLTKAAKGYQLLYANTAKASVVTAIAALVLRKPFLVHLHDIMDAQHFTRLNRWLLVTAANLATGVVANSQATAVAYRAAGGKNRNLAVIPNGFQVGHFLGDVESTGRAVRATICVEDKPLVGLFGRITAWKGQKILIQALGRLPDVHALIVGDALFTDEDHRYKRSLANLAEELGVSDRVHFTGFVPEILPFLKAVDLVVHSSVCPEPFGRVIVEAQLAGKPVIAAKCGAPVEIIEDGVNGILVNPGDPAALALAIETLLRDAALASGMAAKGQVSAAKRYAIDNVLGDWVGFIERTVEGRWSRQSNGSTRPRHLREEKIEEQETPRVGDILEPRRLDRVCRGPTEAGVPPCG
jgi:glycosyltransferase involved in cell wall biosynthesis